MHCSDPEILFLTIILSYHDPEMTYFTFPDLSFDEPSIFEGAVQDLGVNLMVN